MSSYQADWFLNEEGQFDGLAADGKVKNTLADGGDGIEGEEDWQQEGDDDGESL